LPGGLGDPFQVFAVNAEEGICRLKVIEDDLFRWLFLDSFNEVPSPSYTTMTNYYKTLWKPLQCNDGRRMMNLEPLNLYSFSLSDEFLTSSTIEE